MGTHSPRGLAGLALPVAGFAAGVFVTRRLAAGLTAPLSELETAMHRVAEGDFSAGISPGDNAEIASLAGSFDLMKWRLRDTLSSLELAVANLHEKQEQLVEAEKLASLGRVAAGVAHEINNPLAVINEKAGLLQDLLETSGPFPGRERFASLIEGITASVRRCRTITHRLLGYARRPDLTLEPLDLNQEVRQVQEYLTSDLAAKRAYLDLALEAELPPVRSDRVQFEQVLLNVVKNAIDAIPEGGLIQVTTGRCDHRALRVTVRDNGPGIPAEQLKHLFEPFFTTKEKGRGTGLGLFVSRGIMKKLGGRILVESEPGRGTTLVLELPLGRGLLEEASGG
jgi:C4-dicarboxylate-specific signal transduction histidine kinase